MTDYGRPWQFGLFVTPRAELLENTFTLAKIADGRGADGWVPSNSYFPREKLPNMQRRIDEAATAAGRDPASIMRAYNILGEISGSSAVDPFHGTVDQCVFAIVITLLVLDLKEPAHAEGQLLAGLGRQWPAYFGYFASFAYVAVIWLNHHQAFVGVHHVNRGVHFANLTLLFTTALIPFPTAVLSGAFIAGINSADARTAVGLYAGIATAMCVSWLLLYHQVHRDRDLLLGEGVDREKFGIDRARAMIGIVAYLAAGIVGALWVPVIALVVFAGLPIFYGTTSQGLKARRRDRKEES